MTESQFPRYLFPQFTEEELEEASKRSRTSVNWTEYNKWVKDGKPYEEEDFIDQKCKNDSQQRSVGKSIDLYPFYYFIFMYILS